MVVDVTFMLHGSVVMVWPVTEEAKAWVDEKVATEDWQWMGSGFACDPRFAADLKAAAEEDGLITG